MLTLLMKHQMMKPIKNIIQNEGPAVNHGPIEEMEVDENDKFGENNQEKVDANLLKLESILSEMRELYKKRIPNDPEGYVLENHIDRLPKPNDAILQKAACTFAQDATSPLRVHKRKKGTVIPVQVKSHHYIKCICSY